jgi:hypothetical protein
MIRLYFCAFMSMCVFFLFIILVPYSGYPSLYPRLNSRVNLRETLDGRGGVVTTFSLSEYTDTIVLGIVRVTTESSINADAPKSLPAVKLSSSRSFSDREKYPIHPVPVVMDGVSA